MKNAFCFILNALFFLKRFKLCLEFFGHVGKLLDKKAKLNFKIYDIINWKTNSYNSHIPQSLKK